MRSFFMQLCLGLARSLELAMSADPTSNESTVGGGGGGQTGKMKFAPAMPRPGTTTCDVKLCMYFESAVVASGLSRVVHMASDKASPALQSLMNTAVTLPNNMTWWLAPQVPSIRDDSLV